MTAKMRITSILYVFGKFQPQKFCFVKITFFSHCFFYSYSTGGAITNKICLENLQAISMEDTVHDPGDSEPVEPQPVAGRISVQNEDDIIGHPATICYHVCLRQLAEYLLLPTPLCTVKDPLTSVECLAPGPFSIEVKSRGTAAIIQWVC